MGALPQFIRLATAGVPPLSALPGPERLADVTLDLLFRAIGPRAPDRPHVEASPRRTPSRAKPKRRPR
jgi:hypothetical protein